MNNLLALGGPTAALAAAGEDSAAMIARIATAPQRWLEVEVERRAADAIFFLQPPHGRLALRVVPSGQVAHFKVDMLDDFFITGGWFDWIGCRQCSGSFLLSCALLDVVLFCAEIIYNFSGRPALDSFPPSSSLTTTAYLRNSLFTFKRQNRTGATQHHHHYKNQHPASFIIQQRNHQLTQ